MELPRNVEIIAWSESNEQRLCCPAGADYSRKSNSVEKFDWCASCGTRLYWESRTIKLYDPLVWTKNWRELESTTRALDVAQKEIRALELSNSTLSGELRALLKIRKAVLILFGLSTLVQVLAMVFH